MKLISTPRKISPYAKAVARGSKRSDEWLQMLKDIDFYLNEWESRFMRDVGKKMDHNLSPRQRQFRDDIIKKYGFGYVL